MLALLAGLAVWLLSVPGFFLLILLLALRVALEWAALAGIETKLWRAGFAVAVVVPLGMWGLFGPLVNPTAALLAPDRLIDIVFWLALAWWALALVLVLAYPRIGAFKHRPNWLAIGWLIISSTAISLVWLRAEYGAVAIFYLIFLISTADIAAYFVGKRFGRRRLAPEVSPGKTWEGYIGGLIIALFTVLGFGYLTLRIDDWLWYLGASAFVGGFSVVGDLTESLLKRIGGSKDSGDLLPGHGGLLDRGDALIASAPLLAAGIKFGWFPPLILG